MGSQESKVQEINAQQSPVKETSLTESVPSSPILTPLDPRSPTANIARTPLEVILGKKQSSDDEGESKDISNIVLGIDPRSPTVEFNRTPIIVEVLSKKKLQNKNLENVLKSEIQTTPIAAPLRKLEAETEETTPTVANKRKSFVGLLETNLDFTETDLDVVCQAKQKLNASLPVEVDDDIPSNKLKEQMETLKVDESVQTNFEEKSNFDEKVNVTAQVKDFDKKLTNLIYEDESVEDCKLVKTVKVKENNRTPLGIRNMNEDSRKIQSRLKVSDKPRRSDSRIPVLKNQKKDIQCENTPPRSMDDIRCKTKISRWDADKTLII